MRERIEAMKEIWTREEAEYHGEFVDFGPMWLWPKPVQKPHPPIHIGGGGDHVLKRVISYGDGWMPNRGEILGRLPELQRMAAEAGRGRIEVTTYGSRAGGAAEIERNREAGVDRMLWYAPTDGRDSALRRVEDIAELVRPFQEIS
jgi:alkanesulfonate monooxygenase SsuD/methylene tetrahydromethanopterin reductase-like flavin-dependent oxidoreductase (luciferase family)